MVEILSDYYFISDVIQVEIQKLDNVEINIEQLTTVVFKPSWLHVKWRTNVENVRILAFLQVGNTQLTPTHTYAHF